MTMPSQPLAQARAAMRQFFARPKGWFVFLMALWWALLVVFYLFPQIDLSIARSFFQETDCGPNAPWNKVCGGFPYGSQRLFIVIRQFFFYLPPVVAVVLLVMLIGNLWHYGAAYSARKTRDYGIAVLACIIGPGILVNGILKEISGRPRPIVTDLFGGPFPFVPAGDFSGACTSNCSFVSGEAAGSGWLACLIVLLPKPLRPILGPPLMAMSIVSPALRMSFGGHYLSDVVLAWLSSAVVYAGVAICFEMSQKRRKGLIPTKL